MGLALLKLYCKTLKGGTGPGEGGLADQFHSHCSSAAITAPALLTTAFKFPRFSKARSNISNHY